MWGHFTGCQVCNMLYRSVFWEKATTTSPQEIKSKGFVPGAPLCHEHTMSVIKNNFLLVKKWWSEKARNILHIV
jgi:hypothetical protein